MSKPKILIAEDDETLRELVTFYIQANFQVEFIECESAEQAIDFLSKNPQVSAVVSDYNMPGGNGGEILEFIKKKHLKIPFILMTSYKPDQVHDISAEDIFAFVQKPLFYDELKSALDKIFKSVQSKVTKDKYLDIPRGIVLRLPQVVCDLYIKLGEDHFVKLLNKGVKPSDEVFKKAMHKEVEKFFFPATQLKELLLVIEKITAAGEMKKGEEMQGVEALADLTELIFTLNKHFGWSKQLQATVDKNIKDTCKNMSSLPQLRDFLVAFNKNQNHYLYAHSALLAYVASAIATDMKQKALVKELTEAALIHDIALNEAVAEDLNNLMVMVREKRKKPNAKVQLVIDHPELAAHVAMSWESAGEKVAEIVMQHHERPNGEGFPFGLKSKDMDLASSLFIIAEDLVDLVFKSHNPNFSNFFLENATVYGEDHFKKVMDVLRKNFKDD